MADTKSDKTDPLAGLDRHRAAVLALLMTRESNPWMDRWVEAALAAADAADRAAGVVRVDTRDEALVERLLTALTDEGFETPMGFARVDDYVTAPSYTAEHANQVRELVAADEESSRLNREAVRRAVLAALREES